MAHRKNILITILITLTLGAAWSLPDSKDPAKKVVLDILQGKKLTLLMPVDWKLETRQVKGKVPRYFEITPSAGNEFKLLITPMQDPTRPGKLITDAQISLLIRNMKQNISKKAVENQIPILTLKGIHCQGQYYFATDKNPGPREFPYLIQAALGSGQVLLVATILHRIKDSKSINRIFQLLKDIKTGSS
jgi:hypothetical protein